MNEAIGILQEIKAFASNGNKSWVPDEISSDSAL